MGQDSFSRKSKNPRSLASKELRNASMDRKRRRLAGDKKRLSHLAPGNSLVRSKNSSLEGSAFREERKKFSGKGEHGKGDISDLSPVHLQLPEARDRCGLQNAEANPKSLKGQSMRKHILISDEEEGSEEEQLPKGKQIDKRTLTGYKKATDGKYLVTHEENEEFETERVQWDDTSDLDGDDDELMRTMRIQEARRQQIMRKAHLDENAFEITSFKENWINTYLGCDSDFFATAEARLAAPLGTRVLMNGKKRKNNYKGVIVNEKNNKDIAYVYERTFKRAARDAHQCEQYNNFKTCMGQLVRCAVANDKLDLEDAWEAGQLFVVCRNEFIFRVFLNHFEEEGTDSTLMNKSLHCGTLVRSALDFYKTRRMKNAGPEELEKQQRSISKIDLVRRILLQKSAYGKRSNRHRRSITREERHKKATGKNLSEEDINQFRKVAMTKLQGIIDSFENECEDIDNTAPARFKLACKMFDRPALLGKWGMNFLSLLIFFGNGQRPQVYAGLKAPDLESLKDFDKDHGGFESNSPLEVEIHEAEKKPRDLLLPMILFDPVIFTYVLFHVEYVLPVLRTKFHIEASHAASAYLLLNTRTGKKLTSHNVRRTIQKWVNDQDPELHISAMDIRASYATFMVRRYADKSEKGGAAFKALSKDKFLEMLASVMNTSQEQISRVYAAATREGYQKHVAMMLDIVGSEDSEENAKRSELREIVRITE